MAGRSARAPESSDDYVAVPPQDIPAEENLLGACMISSHAIDACLEVDLRPEEFYRGSHGKIWQAIRQMTLDGVTVDAITLCDRLDRDGVLKDVGGRDRVKEIATLVPSVTNVGRWAGIVQENSLLRGLIRVGSAITTLGWERGDDVRGLLDSAEGLMFDLAQERRTSDFIPIRTAVDDTVTRIEELFAHGRQVTGLATGFHNLDNMTAGLQPGNLVILAARPSMGKTALALNIAAHVAKQKKPVAVFTLEMSKLEVTQRLLAAEAMIDAQQLTNGKLDGDGWGKLVAAAAKLRETYIEIDESPALTASEMRSKARRLRLRHPDLALVVVDYIQLMTSGVTDNRVQDVSQTSRTLKVLARELGVPVLALSQLSRQVEQRHDKRPILSDLRESGGLEQDADLVLFIYRDEYYNPEDTDQEGIAEVNIAKHRNGPTGLCKLAFVKRFVRFSMLPPS